jgi:hypothetical protein
MTTAAPSTVLATIQPAFTAPERLALAGFLAGYPLPRPVRCRPRRHRVLRPRAGSPDGGSMTRQVSRVLPSDAGSVRWKVEVIRGAFFKRIEEEKGLGGGH